MLIVLLLCCAYAGTMIWLLFQYDWLRDNKLLHLGHLCAFALQVYLWVRATGGPPGSGGMVGGGASAGILLFGLALVCIVNAPPLAIILGSYVSGAGRWFLSMDQIRIPKSYEQAEAARAEGDLARAAAIYREEIEKAPDDPTAHRRLAEILIQMGQVVDAVETLRRIRTLTENTQPKAWCNATFRLADVIDDLPGGAAGAAKLYREVIRRHPDGPYAEHARQRLRTLPLE